MRVKSLVHVPVTGFVRIIHIYHHFRALHTTSFIQYLFLHHNVIYSL